jgi:hypothetical protein
MKNKLRKRIIERETNEALQTRYANTINRHTLENATLSLHEFIYKYIEECDSEDMGLYRNHKFELTPYQEQFKNQLMEKEYKYLITIKLPSYQIGCFKQTANQKKAIEQLRILIREIEQAYTGRSHFERGGFDFNNVFEHGKSGFFWHTHLAVIADTLRTETQHNELQEAINQVLSDNHLPIDCIKLSYVYDQEGLCMYMVKELEEPPRYTPLKTQESYISNLYQLFGVKIRHRNYHLIKLLKMVLQAVKLKIKKLLFRPNPINKLYFNKIQHSKSQHKPSVDSRKHKR